MKIVVGMFAMKRFGIHNCVNDSSSSKGKRSTILLINLNIKMIKNLILVFLEKKIEEIKNLISEQFEQSKINKERIYTNKQVMKLLGVGAKLIKSYRDEGLIAYSQIKDKIWYRQEDIDAFLNNHHFRAYAQQ